ncbi:DUF6907 domain-containing protein [Streptomyces scabiei]|uniref:DUF6907 domain-containing protein n=1 Tax=Streptomyces scabiei TaxID=1930 RepID=UPI0004E6E713|nr:hypothetical protein [Streptomyces scabiei]KFG05585.1 hypothetical protein IQ61_29275 [Streptomyces scabiei]MDX2829467.1 hypothetical protein [Streptomyces scabiei]MDX3674977.1 hypothetical protein [Streptomyces scabiei]
MSTEPRTITLATEDFGPVTLTCPAWCDGHADHDPQAERADILHCGPDAVLAFHGVDLFTACLVQSPYSTSTDPELGSRTPGVSVFPPARTLTPVSLYSLAAALDGYADQLRGLADQLAGILAGGAR